MKCMILFAVLVVAMSKKIDYFETANELLDMDALIANHDELQAYLNCFLDKGPCNLFSASYKKIVQRSLKDACKRCTDNQKYMYWRFLQGIKEVYPDQHDEFKRYYDPKNKYFNALEKEISQYLKPVQISSEIE